LFCRRADLNRSSLFIHDKIDESQLRRDVNSGAM